MAYSYEYLPDVAIADAAFSARGDTLPELLAAAALATTGVMVELEDIQPLLQESISLTAESREDLLYQWLSELLYVKDVKHLVFNEFRVVITEVPEGLSLVATARGERVDPERHRLGQDVKAVTYHLFGIWEDESGYVARVVLDI